MPNSIYYNLILYDGVCDSTTEMKSLTGIMDNMEDKWVFSSLGRHMFVLFDIGIYSPRDGFSAKIHYGIEFKKFCNYIYLFIGMFLLSFQSIVQR